VGPLCFAQHKLPYVGGYYITKKQAQQGYPYLFELTSWDQLFHDAIFGLRDRGFFDPAKGFKKLGIIYRSCHPELFRQTTADLRASGVKDEQISSYDFGCPTAFANPSDVVQAVLKFRREGVTHMTEVMGTGDMAAFTNVAEQQGFRPAWGLPDDQVIGISYGNQRPNPDNIANALIVTPSRNGEERTPGMTPTAGTAKCDRYFTSHGLQPSYKQPQAAGNVCNQMWMLRAAVEHAPSIAQNALGAGLQRAKSVEFSYPQGPNDFSGNGVTWGGQFWRYLQFFRDCECWRVIDPKFRPSYK